MAPKNQKQQTKKNIPTDEFLLEAYKIIIRSRVLDEAMLRSLKKGRSTFHASSAGHEIPQIIMGMSMNIGSDWIYPYYRSFVYLLSIGFTPKEFFMDFFGKEDSVSSKGRQMCYHWGKKSLRVVSQSACTGTQYLQAVGSAIACLREKKNEIVYVASGEGATSEGDFHEALNWSAREKLPIIIMIEDNGIAISVSRSEQTAGGTIAKIASGYEGLNVIDFDGSNFFESYEKIQEAVTRCRTKKEPYLLRANVVRLQPHSSSDDQAKYRPKKDLEQLEKKDGLVIFEKELLKRKLLTTKTIEAIYKAAKIEMEEAEEWAWHQSNPKGEDVMKNLYSDEPLELSFEASVPSGESIVMVDAINQALDEELKANPKMLIYGEDVAKGKGGVFTATRDLTKKHGEDRVFNSQLAESAIVGTAIGLAVMGYKPVVEIQFGDYIFPAFMQIRNELAMMRYRSGGDWAAPVVIRSTVGGYIAGGHYHSQNIEAFFAHIPGLYVVYPSNAADAKGLLKTACRMNDPVLFLEHKFLYRQGFAKTPAPDKDYFLPLGKAKVVKTGTDATIITYGAMVRRSIEAAEEIEKQSNVSIEVIDLRTIIPYDKETILQSVKKTGKVMIVHEDVQIQGFGGEIAAFLSQHAFQYLDAPIIRVAGVDVPVPFHEELESVALPNTKRISVELKKLMDY